MLLAAAVALAACGQQSKPDGNNTTETSARNQTANQCAQPDLALPGSTQPLSTLLIMDAIKANFATAFKAACAKGLLTEKPLLDPKASDQKRLFMVNAPEANVASIYLSEIDSNRMILEYPFLTTDGRSNVPSADELEEAIYCSVRGATPEEQESSGRCLVD